MTQQSLPLCILFAVAAGLCNTLSTASLTYPAHLDRQAGNSAEEDIADSKHSAASSSKKEHSVASSNKKEHFLPVSQEHQEGEKKNDDNNEKRKKVSKFWWRVAYFSNFLFQLGVAGCTILSLLYGPVSISAPITVSTRILSTMVVFGYILKTEDPPPKEIISGNFFIILSTVLLVFNGPIVSNGEEPLIDYNNTMTIVWAVAICCLVLLSVPYLFLLGCTNSKCLTDKMNFIFLQIAEVSIGVLGTTSNKLAFMGGSRLQTYIGFALTITSGLLLVYSTILRSTVIISQATFIPINLCLNIIFNGLTGIFFWSDNIRNMNGYITVYVQLLLAVYLVSPYNSVVEESDLLLEGGLRHTLANKSILIRKNATANKLYHDRDARISLLEHDAMKQNDIMVMPPKASFLPRSSVAFEKKKVHFQVLRLSTVKEEPGENWRDDSSFSEQSSFSA